MSTAKDFDSFVKAQQRENESPLDPAKELDDWRKALADLYGKVESYLADYTKSGQIAIEHRKTTLDEEFSGPYEVEKLALKIGRQSVALTPIGTMLIGSKGRVDLEGPRGRARLALINKKITDARQLVRISISVGGRAPDHTPTTDATPIEWEWKIAGQPPTTSFTPLTKDAFLELVLGVANG